MSVNRNGALRPGTEKLNQFALVIYIPDPLAAWLDELRLELVAGCRPRAHVTVLPPRPIQDVPAAMEQARIMAPEFPPFEIEAGKVEVFPKTNVIYIGLGRGTEQMRSMHRAMNNGPLAFAEPYPYHPHITLAQEFDPADTSDLLALSRERWQTYGGPRSFHAEAVAFVQNSAGNCWLDLEECALGLPAPVRKLRK